MDRFEYVQRGHELARRGIECYNAKLNDSIVREIRANRHGLTDKQQAEKYGVHPQLVYKIRKRERWSHVR